MWRCLNAEKWFFNIKHYYSSFLTRHLYSSYEVLPFLHPLPFAVEFAIYDTYSLFTVPGIANGNWQRKKKKKILLHSTYIIMNIHLKIYQYATYNPLLTSLILSPFLFSLSLLFLFILLILLFLISFPLPFLDFCFFVCLFCVKVAKTRTSSHQILWSDPWASGLLRRMWFLKKSQPVGKYI